MRNGKAQDISRTIHNKGAMIERAGNSFVGDSLLCPKVYAVVPHRWGLTKEGIKHATCVLSKYVVDGNKLMADPASVKKTGGEINRGLKLQLCHHWPPLAAKVSIPQEGLNTIKSGGDVVKAHIVHALSFPVFEQRLFEGWVFGPPTTDGE